ncbi:MAG: TolC family protein [Longimicrobiales bacterium]
MTSTCTRLGPTAAAALAYLLLVPGVHAQVLTLTDAIDAALATHPVLAAADARVLAAEGASDAARAARLPAASVTANLTHFQEPMVVAPLHSLSLGSPPTFDRSLLQGQLGALYTLFDGGVRGSRIRGSDAMGEATRAFRGSAEMEVLEQTASAYTGTVAARALLEAARAQVAALQSERDRAQRHLEAGSAAELEVLRADAVLQLARAAEASALARAGLAERALARAMGLGSEALSSNQLADLAPRAISPGERRQDSPILRQADRSVAAAEALLSEERGGRLPSVVLGAGVQDFGTATGDHVLEWRAGVELSWPLFTGGAQGASVRRAAANLDAARAELAGAKLRVDQEIDAARTALVEADARLQALEAAVTQWTEVARIEALALQAGSGEQRDLLRAEAGLFESRAARVVARQDAILARVRLARAEGTLTRDWFVESMETR